jgi:hypothetical protein
MLPSSSGTIAFYYARQRQHATNLPASKIKNAVTRACIQLDQNTLDLSKHTDWTVIRQCSYSQDVSNTTGPPFLSRIQGRFDRAVNWIETHPVVELLEVDDGAVLAFLECLVGPRAVVVGHPPRAAPLFRVTLLRAIPSACHSSPKP